MTRRGLAALAAAATLALPVLALAAMVANAEWQVRGGTVIRVPITGSDPRDPLRGHYLRYRFAWNWQGEPGEQADAICVLAAGENPPVRPLPPEGDPGCRLVLRRDTGDGARWGAFMPAGVSDKLFVPEAQAQALESELRSPASPGITVDLVIRPDGTARIKGWQASPVR